MARYLLMAISPRAINRFPVESLREAQNLEDFLEQVGGYREIEVYEVRRAGESFSDLCKLEQVAR